MSNNTIAEIGAVLGSATFIANLENGSPEWHALRATGIGGSDVGIICGLSKWTSPFTLWAKKTNRLPEKPLDSEAAEWGNLLEPVVAARFEREHPELKYTYNPGTWRHAERTYQLANPDGVYVTPAGNYGIHEIKTAQYEDEWREGTNGEPDTVPASYRAQVLWYLDTFGFAEAIMSVLFHGNKYREYRIAAAPFEQAANRAAVERFLGYIETDAQPDFDGAANTYETVRELHPDIDPEGQVELGQLGIYYTLAGIEADKANAHLMEMKTRVLDAMGTAKRGTIEGDWKVTRQAKAGGNPYLVNKRS